MPNRGRDIAPFIVQFGERLLSYEIIAHIHTKQSPHDGRLSHWCQGILKLMMGSTGDVGHIIELLQGSAKIVFPENLVSYFRDESGWADNYPIAAEWLDKACEEGDPHLLLPHLTEPLQESESFKAIYKRMGLA